MGAKGSKDKAKKALKVLTFIKRKPFKTIGLPDMDQYFSDVQPPLDSICDMSDAIEQANDGLLMLCEVEELITAGVERTVAGVMRFFFTEMKKSGKDFRIGINDEGNLDLICDEPEGVLGKIYKGVRDLVEAIKTLVETIPELIPQIETAVASTQDLPGKLQNAALQAGLTPTKLPGAVKKLAFNIKYLGGIPKDVKNFIKNIKDLVVTIKEIADKIKEGAEQIQDKVEEITQG
eukprot:TRINITY_DN9667_c0_g1_i1.p1 TRINITY_DN9667_c0_g1~~TRINITY_DN9667_c0_g1_i1.p1  ORF type:complete len:234 (+),score=52.32 TRINITY_DN9667_c0_g1_i1:87-788(+)